MSAASPPAADGSSSLGLTPEGPFSGAADGGAQAPKPLSEGQPLSEGPVAASSVLGPLIKKNMAQAVAEPTKEALEPTKPLKPSSSHAQSLEQVSPALGHKNDLLEPL